MDTDFAHAAIAVNFINYRLEKDGVPDVNIPFMTFPAVGLITADLRVSSGFL